MTVQTVLFLLRQQLYFNTFTVCQLYLNEYRRELVKCERSVDS